MRIKEMTNAQLIQAYDSAVRQVAYDPEAVTKLSRWEKLQAELCKRLGMTDEEARDLWDIR